MIHSLSISGYRGFRHLDMTGLGWINLLVGRNNSGKTSVLEALYLLASGGDPFALWRTVARRGERLEIEPVGGRPPEAEMELSHIFHGHDLRPNAKFSVSTRNTSPTRSITFSIQEATTADHPELFSGDRAEGASPRLILAMTGTPRPVVGLVPLSVRGGLRSDTLDQRMRRGATDRRRPAQYISTESLSVDDLTAMWNDISLTEAEEKVISALRFLEPNIERLAPIVVMPARYYYYSPFSKGGFKVKLKNIASPIPIGSLGDGIWRMLAMAIALIRAKDGVLLIDEIDTGLHHTVMADMWNLLYRTAREFNVQVFATTHSYDCVHSLAFICNDSHHNVTIQRIETDKQKSIPFTDAEIRMAAKRHIELR